MVAFLILLVDMKLKNDIVGELESAEGTSVGGSGRWNYSHGANPPVSANGHVRFAPGVEEGANPEVPGPVSTEAGDLSELLDRAGDSELPQDDKPVGA